MHRYPEGTIATADDLCKLRLASVIASASSPGYSGLWQALITAASVARQEARFAEAKALWLLADAVSMRLKPKSVNEPFAPMPVFGDQRSAIAGDFSPDDIEMFAAFATEVEDHLIRARLSDVVWLCRSPRNADFARVAIDAYRTVPLTAESWAWDALYCWERAIALCRQLRTGAGQRLEEIEAELLTIFDNNLGSEEFFALSISKLLFDNNLGQDRGRKTAKCLADRGIELAGMKIRESRECLKAAATWYGRLQDRELQADMTCAVAETWARAAELKVAADQPSNMAAASCYEKAIQTLRQVPRMQRDARAVNLRLTELYTLLEKAGKASLDEMAVVSSGSIDIREFVQTEQTAVRGKNLSNALFAFCNIHPGAHKSKLKEIAEKMLTEQPLQAMLSLTRLSRDGRVIAKRPGFDFGSIDSEEYRVTLWSEMVKRYSEEIDLIAKALLIPALDVLLLEHRVREADLELMVCNSPIVPTGRAALITKGLLAGFERDLVSAIHILIPQVEHLIRWRLKATSVKTTTHSHDGIETENGMSTLVDLPEVSSIFGEDLAFEFKALFCDAFGPNLRNEIAHGLRDAAGCQTAQTFYAWWLVLRITLNTFWIATHKPQTSPSSED